MILRGRAATALVVIAVMVGTGCGGTGSRSGEAVTTTTSTTATTPAETGETTDAAPPGGGGGRPGTGGAGGGSATDPARPAAGTGASGAGTGGSARPGTTAGPAPIAPGGYSFRQSGVSGAGTGTPVPARGTLTVEPARSDGTQVAHRVIEPSSTQDYTLSFRPDGLFLTSTDQSLGGTRVHCDFSPPLPAPPWPPTTGRSFSGRGQCGTFTAEVQGRITGEREVSLDGSSYRVVVIESTLATRGQVESTGRQVDWFAPDLRLVVHQEMRREGTFGSFPFVVDVTSDLESARPS